MISLLHLVSDRSAIAIYLELDPTDPSRVRTRVWFSCGINIVTDDLREGLRWMGEMSDIQRKSVAPLVHIVISFGRRDWTRCAPAFLEQVARAMMKELGFPHHYAMIVGHRDKAHSHGHLVVDRRDPVTGVLWPKPHWRQVHRACRVIERAFGLEEVPSHLAKLADQSWPSRDRELPLAIRRERWRTLKKVNEGVPEPFWRPLELHEEPFLIRARVKLQEYFERALPGSWWTFEHELARIGFRIERAGTGLRVVELDGEAKAPASHVSRFAVLPHLESRFGETLHAYRAKQAAEVEAEREISTAALTPAAPLPQVPSVAMERGPLERDRGTAASAAGRPEDGLARHERDAGPAAPANSSTRVPDGEIARTGPGDRDEHVGTSDSRQPPVANRFSARGSDADPCVLDVATGLTYSTRSVEEADRAASTGNRAWRDEAEEDAILAPLEAAHDAAIAAPQAVSPAAEAGLAGGAVPPSEVVGIVGARTPVSSEIRPLDRGESSRAGTPVPAQDQHPTSELLSPALRRYVAHKELRAREAGLGARGQLLAELEYALQGEREASTVLADGKRLQNFGIELTSSARQAMSGKEKLELLVSRTREILGLPQWTSRHEVDGAIQTARAEITSEIKSVRAEQAALSPITSAEEAKRELLLLPPALRSRLITEYSHLAVLAHASAGKRNEFMPPVKGGRDR